MIFEHWIYSSAIAIIVGMIYYKRTGRDHSWRVEENCDQVSVPHLFVAGSCG